MRTVRPRTFVSGWSSLLFLIIVSLLGLPSAAAQPPPVACTSGFALWASGQGRDETLLISGSSNRINGAAHSNADLRISGSSNQISGAVEYATLFEDSGDSNTYMTPAEVAPVAALPIVYALADYQPGGRVYDSARADGRLTVVDGDLDISEPTVLDGLYVVSGDAKLAASDIRGDFTIVALGSIDVSGSNIRGEPYSGGLLFFSARRAIGSEVIKIAGSNNYLPGIIYAPGGTIELSGSNNEFFGMLIGDALRLNGSSLIINYTDTWCFGGSPLPIVPEPPSDPDAPPEPDPDPPAVVTIDDDDVVQRFEIVNTVVFVTLQVTVVNTGGKTKDTFLILNLPDADDDDDGRFTMIDVQFLEGIGYVREYSEQRIVIGMGRYNVLRGNSPVTVDIRFRLADDDDDDGEVRFALQGELFFNDSTGDNTLALPLETLIIPLPEQPQPAPQNDDDRADLPRLSVDQIDPRFIQIWATQGGVAIFGLPLTTARTWDDGTIIQVFERARFEYREVGTVSVQYGRLAAELGYATPPTRSLADLDDDERAWYFAETGHVIATPFRDFWRDRGGLILFGLPIGVLYTADDGRQVQCFERVCMQYFPEFSGTPHIVQLQLLGVEWLLREDD